ERVVGRPPFIDPSRGGNGVQVAYDLGLFSRLAGRLDPDTGSPSRLWRAHEITDDLAAAQRNAAAGVVDRKRRRNLILGRSNRLEPGREQRLGPAVAAMTLGQQGTGGGNVRSLERPNLDTGHSANLLMRLGCRTPFLAGSARARTRPAR